MPINSAMKKQIAKHLAQAIASWPSTIAITRQEPSGSVGSIGDLETETVTVASDLTVAIFPASKLSAREYERAASGEVVTSSHVMVAPFEELDRPYQIEAGDVVDDGEHEYLVLFVASVAPGQHQVVDLYLIR
jgi:hypothetical protein